MLLALPLSSSVGMAPLLVIGITVGITADTVYEVNDKEALSSSTGTCEVILGTPRASFDRDMCPKQGSTAINTNSCRYKHSPWKTWGKSISIAPCAPAKDPILPNCLLKPKTCFAISVSYSSNRWQFHVHAEMVKMWTLSWLTPSFVWAYQKVLVDF